MAEPVFSDAIPELLAEHFRHLTEGSGISVDVIRERKYRSLLGKSELEKLGFTPAQQRTPGILIPLWSVDGKEAGHQFRPDHPRTNVRGKPVKYESPTGSSNRLDCSPRSQKAIENPQVPLWITEGSKKADALASKGACAISVTGVWGFKGKNQFGGITFLTDWDYVALKGRTVYLAFDSDIVTKEPVRKALEHIGEHLKRKGGVVQIIQLPQLEGQSKTGIDDYLLRYSLQDAERLAGNFRIEETEDKNRFVSGFVLPDGTVGEMVVSGDDERSFMIVANGSVRKAYQYETPKVTFFPTNDLMVGEVVHFAKTAVPYDSQAALFKEIRRFIHRYLELPEDFEEITSLYVLLTWVYEFAPSIPYLRVIGDWGTGKTRFLQVAGSICFRPIFASGATTPAPIFRILEQFRGTLVFDEADFKDSAAWSEMVKLLNNGYRPGMPVLRADKENGKWYPRSYQVFGPKLISTRFNFKDEALESRCLTSEMLPLTRDDIPRVLPPAFDKEVNELRSKLLTFRLANLTRLKGKTFGNELLEPNLQPRLQEILIPLKAMLNGDHAMVESMAGFVRRLQDSLFSRRQESNAGRVLAAIINLHKEGVEISSKMIAEKANQMDEEVPPLVAEKIGWQTKRLGLEKTRIPGCGRRVIVWEEEKIRHLAIRYGLSLDNALSSENPSQPSQPSRSGTEPACEGSGEGLCDETEPSRDSEAVCESSDGCEGFFRDTEEKLGMTVEQAVAIWEAAGRPIIHLGPGENCFGLDKLLSHRDINERHLVAIREWLEERQR
ncbi:hypothetical protein X793_03535 [Dehalococcoides mccartyi CG4]|uniref:DUF3854 domain-containing protein n=1 Tax=Dehalococcoides mccartyi TaxID=61435 RepID=UPI0004E03091|nr:DUF3854 domain-containing protein [Dehalococcoides mccartyi]AII59434.1 hypothetical protein X793_03535 [Dehalococcoides mccartyi CG4]